MKIAVTGATGFVGAALIRQLCAQGGFEIAALARDPARMPNADADAVTAIKGDLNDDAALGELARGADAFLHLAGVTHARRNQEYQTINSEGAARAARAAAREGARFVLASSLSAREPQLSPYAASKADAERVVGEAAGASPWIALRLPAIYGPGDRATLPYFRLVTSGWALEPRTDPPARASLLYVEDAARALIAAIGSGSSRAVYEVGDEKRDGREWREIGVTLGNVVNKKVKRFKIPRTVVAAAHIVSRSADLAQRKIPEIRAGQVNEFFHADWVARHNLFADAAGWSPATGLEDGMTQTVRWYRDNALL